MMVMDISGTVEVYVHVEKEATVLMSVVTEQLTS